MPKTITSEQFLKNPGRVVERALKSEVTHVVGADGKLRVALGMNGKRYVDGDTDFDFPRASKDTAKARTGRWPR